MKNSKYSSSEIKLELFEQLYVYIIGPVRDQRCMTVMNQLCLHPLRPSSNVHAA